MTMLFRTIKDNLITILNDNAGGQYTVVGYQQQGVGAEEVKGNKRRVQVFYGQGEFPKGESGIYGPTQHDVNYTVRLMCSAPAKGDLTVINNPASTAPELAAAIAAFQVSSEQADLIMDELIDLVYQNLMAAENYELGQDELPYTAKDRWIGSITKDEPLNHGEYVALTADISFNCKLVEEIRGLDPTAAVSPVFEVTDDLEGDDVEKTGSDT